MLDPQGITLAEVEKRYPRQFQKLNYDVLMDYDSTYKPKVISTFQMCINTIIMLLMMKPGQYPSIPELGIDIDQYLHDYADDKTIPSTIINKLYDQCNRLNMALGLDIKCDIDKLPNGMNALIVTVSGDEYLAYGADSHKVVIGITYNELNDLYVRKTYIK